jgi:arylsulfatase A
LVTRTFLVLLLVLLAVGAAAGGTRPTGLHRRPPNLVLILADDLGYADVGFNGRKEWPTRSLDRLAREGRVFSRFYAASPVCAPSRAALLTGKSGIHNGVVGNGHDLRLDEVTIAEALKPYGYRTGLFGKWHGNRAFWQPGESIHPLDQGFDEFIGSRSAGHAWKAFPNRLWFGRELRPVNGYADTLATNHSIDFIRRSRRGPFFLMLSYRTPHFELRAPMEDFRRYAGRFPERDAAAPANAAYAAMIDRMDREIGRVLRALDRDGLARDTLVLFTSDHGASFEGANWGASRYHQSNRPFRGAKRSLLEGGLRVPTVVRWPGRVPAGTRCDEPLSMLDILPSLVAAAGGVRAPEWQLDGVDALAAWTGSGALPARTLFWEWRFDGMWQTAAMRNNFKMISDRAEGVRLYDVVADPRESRPLEQRLPYITRTLAEQSRAWLESTVATRRAYAALQRTAARPGVRRPVFRPGWKRAEAPPAGTATPTGAVARRSPAPGWKICPPGAGPLMAATPRGTAAIARGGTVER